MTTAKYVVPRLLGPFCQVHPGVEVMFEVGNRSAIIESLARNDDDLTVMGMPPRGMDIVTHSFAENPQVIVAPRGHPLARGRRIPLARLAGQRFFAFLKAEGGHIGVPKLAGFSGRGGTVQRASA